MLITCDLHKITYNNKLDPHCPQCTLGGITGATQSPAVPGEAGAPQEA